MISTPAVPKVRRVRTGVLFVGMFVGITACGAGSAVRGGSRDEITRNQINAVPSLMTAFSIVQRLQPRWLRARIQATLRSPEPIYPEVFVDNVRYGPMDSLNQISSVQIERIEYLSATDATIRYGTGYMGGIILVVIR